ncbi:MAG: DUF2336 domain-containing protein [Alphaproteobacteria bacterium]|nr:DUF2336 domain-containing protein [Alphaproteobacteria bacterium]
MTEDRLTIRDVERLAAGPSSEVRAETAAKVASEYSRMSLSQSELELAQDIFRLMVKDAEMRVREALSINLKSTPLLPHDIAMTLAQDVDDVSVPMLRASEVLTTEDLIEIVQSQSPDKQQAIASRKTLHADVADALVETGEQSVVARLVSNPGAHLTEPCIHRVVDQFGDVEAIQEPLVNRPVLPVTVAERLVTKVASHLRGELLSRHKISPDLATDLILQSRERATVGLAMGASDDEVEALVGQLANNDRLTPSLVLRAICMGNLKFFEHALARMAGVPVANTRLLVHDQSGAGLDTLSQRAEFPMAILPAIKAAVLVVDETDFDGRPGEAERYSRRVIERVLTQYESLDVEFESDDLEYLLTKLGQLPVAGEPVH